MAAGRQRGYRRVSRSPALYIMNEAPSPAGRSCLTERAARSGGRARRHASSGGQSSGLLHLADRGVRDPGEIVRQEIIGARPHPFVEVDLLELAVVPRLHDLEVLVPQIPDRVSETCGDVD